MLLQEESDLDCMYFNRSIRVLQNPHLIHTTSRVASVTVALNPGENIANLVLNLIYNQR